jgi:dipeptidase E
MFSMNTKIRALLLGSSPYHAKRAFYPLESSCFTKIFAGSHKVLFIPFALKKHTAYTEETQKLFSTFNCETISLSEYETNEAKQQAVEKAEGLFIGGGNTFRLLAALHDFGIFDIIKRRIGEGVPYLGTSAGATLFCPTIKTTNDMPIVAVKSLVAFGFLPFQINPHYPDAEAPSASETRKDRLNEFHEENNIPIIGLRESCFLSIENGHVELNGDKSALLFRQGHLPTEIDGTAFNDFMAKL